MSNARGLILGVPRSVNGRSLIPRSLGLMVHEIERPPHALQREVELIVGSIEIVEDRLESGIGIHVVAKADEEAVGDIEEDGHFAEVVPEL